jgi:hypothetical protein
MCFQKNLPPQMDTEISEGELWVAIISVGPYFVSTNGSHKWEENMMLISHSEIAEGTGTECRNINVIKKWTTSQERSH